MTKSESRVRPLVLVVDDDAMVRLLVRETLEQAHFDVIDVGNGSEALEVVQQKRPALTLLDVTMPGMDGFAVCSAMRALPEGLVMPIIMLTGRDDLESIRHAFEAGATDFAAKPINWTLLGHRVRYMLRAARTQGELRASEARLAHAQRLARIGNWEYNVTTQELYCSDEACSLYGLDPATWHPCWSEFLQQVHPEDRDRLTHAIEAALYTHHGCGVDHRIVLADGAVRHLHTQSEMTGAGEGQTSRILATSQDITERKNAEDQIRQLAYYDALTDLPNRVLFNERLTYGLINAKRHGHLVAVLFLDLDRFKRVNDTLGHSLGDGLLRAVAGRLRHWLREGDHVTRSEAEGSMHTVARLGGDEFIVALSGIERAEDITRIASRLLDALAEPFMLDQHEIYTTASIGISVYPDDGADTETLLKNADTAMYHAKDAGRNTFQFYAQPMNARALERLTMEASLKRALEKNEFLLHFQPQVDAEHGVITGVEALVRWAHPELGMVSPLDFIPLAEETGLIVPLGEWVLRAACAQMRAWLDAGYPPLRMAVNLSGRQFRQRQLAQRVQEICAEVQVDPRYLELEITESVLMHSSNTIVMLEELRALGAKLSIDDFGTGYSSLSYLKRFPIDALKIDRSFVRDIASDPDDAAIATAIIAMARSLGLQVIAEGVENEEQLSFLYQQGCRAVQGFYYSKPLASPALSDLLRRQAGGECLWAGKA